MAAEGVQYSDAVAWLLRQSGLDVVTLDGTGAKVAAARGVAVVELAGNGCRD